MIYLDAIIVKVRDGGHVRNKAAHIAVGVDIDGIKHVLGIWVQATEGAKFWASVCAELANRGVRDVLIVCCDGLTGFPEAIAATWPEATVQTCVVHLIRAAMRFVNYTDRKAVAAALKPIYQAANADGGADRARSVRGHPARQEVSVDGQGVPGRVGAVHPVPGVPAGVAPGDLHDELDRVVELPAPQGHQEPRPLPQRRRRGQAAVAGDLRHRRQTSPRTRQGTRPTRQPNAKHPAASSKARSPPTGNKPSSNSPSSTPTASTPTSEHHDPAAYTNNLTGSSEETHMHRTATPDRRVGLDTQWAETVDRLRAFVAARVDDREIAADITQDVIVRSIASGALERVDNPVAWLYRSARNAVIDHYRTRRQHDPLDEPDRMARPGHTRQHP